MDLEGAFLADIADHPGDPVPWLIFADWLQERDDPRGELVRLLRLCWDEPRHREFADRHERLQNLFASGVRLPLPRFMNSWGMEFVLVPPGTAWLGGVASPGKRKVTVAPFWLGTTPVTQSQSKAAMGRNPSWFGREYGHRFMGPQPPIVTTDADLTGFPVECVSYDDALKLIAAMNQAETGRVYRLPTDDEWEFAVRSPVTCRGDCAFSYYFARRGHELTPEMANFGGQPRRPTTVASYPPNRLGLYDLHGNVYEWVESGPASLCGLRGGAWNIPAARCRAATRTSASRGSTFSYVGIRLACDWVPPVS